MKYVRQFLVAIALMPAIAAAIAQPVPIPVPVLVHIHVPVRPVHYVEIYPGSLRGNVIRLSQEYGWPQVMWTVPDDYHWVGQVRVAANNLPDILRKILMNYPLQADFYEGNHVIVIKPRTLQA